MGHEDFSLIQVVTDFAKEKWPLQPFKLRLKEHPFKSLKALDYDHYGIEWPFLYVVDEVVYVVNDFDADDSRTTLISAADPQFFDKLSIAIEKYLEVISKELFLP